LYKENPVPGSICVEANPFRDEEWDDIAVLVNNFELDIVLLARGYDPEVAALAARLRGIGKQRKFNTKQPHMPVSKVIKEHRDKKPKWSYCIPACVARPVGEAELSREPLALKATKAEWGRLRAKPVWDIASVREWNDVAAGAFREGREIHTGRFFGICAGKGFELPKGDEMRKYKYRVVFQGNRVINRNWEVALFQNLGSASSTMEAGKACDAYGSIQYHDVEQADAEQAYVQADLERNTTWNALPEEAWPSRWKGAWRCYPQEGFLWPP
jgi:hypothetical protein